MLHKHISGGGRYLPMAQNMLRRLLKLNLPYVQQRYDTGDTTIIVTVCGNDHYIRISDNPGVNYQYFSTGPVKNYGPSASFGFPVTRGYALTAAKQGTPRASSAELDMNVPPRWTYESDPPDITQDFPLKYLWQIEGIPQHAYYPKDTSGTPPVWGASGVAAYPMLASSWSQANPLLSLHTLGGVPPDTSRVDMTYDIAPSVFFAQGSPIGLGGGMGLAPDADWYKRAALRKVTHETFGTRWFVILTDVSNMFHIYPLDAPTDDTLQAMGEGLWPGQAIKTSVSELGVKRIQAPLPAWARAQVVSSARQWVVDNSGLGDTRQYLKDIPQHVWTFNSTATRACAVIFEDLPTYAFPTVGGKPTNGFMQISGKTTPDITESLPGMLEVDIMIALIGTGPNDWLANVTTMTTIQPTVDKQFIVAAGYSWVVPGANYLSTNAADLDDLVLLKGEIYFPTSDRYIADKSILPAASKCLLKLYNYTKADLHQTFLLYNSNYIHIAPAYGTNVPARLWTADTLVLALDLRILGVVLQQKYTTQLPTGEYQTTQRVRVHVRNRLVKTIDMETDTARVALLDSAHADISDGVSYYAPDDVGTYNTGTSGGELYNFYNNMSLWNNAPPYGDMHGASAYVPWVFTYAGYGGSFNAGAYLYASKIAATLWPDHKSAFAVHPNGSWSVVTDPIFYYSGPSASPSEALDTTLMRQTVVDVLYIGKSRKLISGAHRTYFNKAFHKSYTQADFQYNFSVVTITAGNYPTGLDYWTDTFNGDHVKGQATLLKAQHASDPNAYVYIALNCYVYAYANSAGVPYTGTRPKFQSTSTIVNHAYIDVRFPNWSSFGSLPTIAFAGHIATDSVGKRVYSVGLMPTDSRPIEQGMSVPFLRGSAMFY